MQVDRLWLNARLATLDPAKPGLGIIDDGVIAAKDGRIAWVGPRDDTLTPAARESIDLAGRWVTPGLIDCHTHLVYGGDRAKEFEQRLSGASYEEIARAGGGIVSTVLATRRASEDELVSSALSRLDALIAEGVTTIEIKSGYGLETETEVRQLRVARRLGRERAVSVVTTFLGAHTLPPEAAGDKDAYIEKVCREMLSAVATLSPTGRANWSAPASSRISPQQERGGKAAQESDQPLRLADAVDAFMEGIAFDAAQTARVFDVAKMLGLPVKLHADQLSNLGGATLAARYGALSADHLEHTDEAGAAAMAKAGTVAVLLPGAFYFLRESKLPPVALLRKHGAHIALATDSNPGSSPLTSLLLAMNMAATLFRLTVDEIIAGVTREAARALGKLDRIGTLEIGKCCDLAIWNVERLAEIPYRMGFNPLYGRVWRGR
jgi:imidazolonepropionase